MFAEVVVNLPGLAASFHYAIPDHLEISVGHLVTVPFGPRRAQGLVIALADTAPVAAVKDIEELLDPEPVLTPAQIRLAAWMAQTYLAAPAECLTLMLPPGLSKRADTLYTLPALRAGAELKVKHPLQQTLLNLIQTRGPLQGRQLDRSLPRQNWRAAAEALTRAGLLRKQSFLEPPSARAKQVRTARLCATPAQVAEARPRLSPRSPAKAARLAKVLDCLAAQSTPLEVSWVYAETGAKLTDLRDLAEMGLVVLGEAEVWRDPLAGQTFVLADPPELTADQHRVWAEISQRQAQLAAGEAAPARDNVFLLHGVTGSGKTEIYLRALAEALQHGRRAIVLVPEIALTPQTVQRFAARFPGRVTVWHSELNPGERYDNWRRARAGQVDVVIGARSALFAPLPQLGLMVLDEEHDPAYKQDPPFAVPYHARDTAVEYARQLGAVCLLGSATPDLVSYHRARQGEYRLLELPRRILGHARAVAAQARQYHIEPRYHALENASPETQTIELPPVEVVDLRQELRVGNTSLFSRALQAALTETLSRHEQAILFLNRRGAATYVFCRDCGQTLTCPHCALPLTQHSLVEQLICHHCNYRRPPPKKCPHCQSPRIRFFGAGTQKVEEAVRTLFPQAVPLRWDRDATRFKGAHDLILQQFSQHQADVLIGTQMIAKGLDLPLVTLVGVISADVGLGLPDYHAAERTFQILTQVAGRAGRSLLGGRVILQTYQPDHYALQAAAGHDYAGFYAREVAQRRDLNYPPFCRLLRLIYRHARADHAEAEARLMAQQLHWRLSEAPHAELAGPTPCFFEKISGEYRWQIILRAPQPAQFVAGLNLKGWYVDVDPVSLL